ncbi:hypothetical protein E5163_07630 [Marinicauda algicola]|uniref:Uncharacterized protein n=1 Tax=Marinicauda algicola TaxID=2029849 RepID=A0A4S2H0P7_9PROT|nr:hypothetical protein [Marinicauda algicola]TGY88994.1 hypothetical protein E5163_07630 [Marinicauda algicola]
MTYKASHLSGGYGRNAGKRWRPGELAELRALVNRGAPVRKISLKLGRPVSAIRSKASALGLSVAADEDQAPPRPAPPRPHTFSRPHPAPSCPRQLELFG